MVWVNANAATWRRNKKEPIQGKCHHTRDKIEGIRGIAHTRFTQFKNQFLRQKFPNMTVIDFYCGDGENDLGDIVVDGTPTALVSARRKSEEYDLGYDCDFIFNDIRRDATTILKAKVNTLWPGMDNRVQYENRPAQELMTWVHQHIISNRKTYFILVIDPNGPKDFPYHELHALANDPRIKSRVDIIYNMSVTALKRCYVQALRADFKWMTDIKKKNKTEHELMIELCGGRHAWIRERLDGDKHQWCIIAAFGRSPPGHEWKKKRYVHLNSWDGVEALRSYGGKAIRKSGKPAKDIVSAQGVLL